MRNHLNINCPFLCCRELSPFGQSFSVAWAITLSRVNWMTMKIGAAKIKASISVTKE
jgi:hypothetical protein